ncbi:MAG: T9SS type A sorting domain-containing protein [Bacteroidetes bacterium]|nr:T9SS type A sorting domain-containing protein [Bacteroidota bacterium]
MKRIYILLVVGWMHLTSVAQTVVVTVDANAGRKPISPYIYGKNGNVSDDPSSPTTSAQWKFLRDAGLRFSRENGGNNCSRYNWRKKITCHPDWYNNVYATDWDYMATKLRDSLPNAQGMWGFQLIGKAAANTTHNFDDWNYNGSNWWSGVNQNLAGGGVPNGAGGSAATTDGNPNLYLENWTADSTVSILDHWFGPGGLGLNNSKIKYWSMDNEPDIWYDTHDDVISSQPTAEAFMQLYFSVAKKARAKYPAIKLTGPVPASEWQWYAWNNAKIVALNGQTYTWLEFFIKRISEEQAASGIRLLDVIDIHSYPAETNSSDIVQLHRLYFDTTYSYPGANGVKTTAASGWDNSITQEFVFERCNRWLNQYLGINHGVKLGISEYGFTHNNANVSSVSYASLLGTFSDNGVEFLSPWYWNTGMWETLHLFSRYAKTTRVKSVSNQELNVSAYSSVNTSNDSMTVILVNRHLTASKTVSMAISNFTLSNGNYATKQLNALPGSETFVSHTNNALVQGNVNVTTNTFTINLPALSTTAVLLKGTGLVTSLSEQESHLLQAKLFPNPTSGNYTYIDLSSEKIMDVKMDVYNSLGQIVFTKQYVGQNPSLIEIPSFAFEQGIYAVTLSTEKGKMWSSWLVKM